MFGYLKKRRREKVRAQPFPETWGRILQRNVPLVGMLPADDREELLGHVHVFLAEKHFEGCGGLPLTEEVRLTIASQACVLLLHRQTDYYPRLRSILVYPSTYIMDEVREIGGGIFAEGEEPHFGHTQSDLGALVLAWDEVLEGGRFPDDGVNLVFHEFAHQLDFEDLNTDGTPALSSREQYRSWATTFEEEFEALRRASEAGSPTLLDDYGAENPAEFFAVATECFFELPHELRELHPALYDELVSFYRQDPASFLR